MSENAVTSALRRMAFGAEEMTAHGFRTSASTMLNESGLWHPDAIERALAHRPAGVHDRGLGLSAEYAHYDPQDH